jgi:hypothetical protein
MDARQHVVTAADITMDERHVCFAAERMLERVDREVSVLSGQLRRRYQVYRCGTSQALKQGLREDANQANHEINQ